MKRVTALCPRPVGQLRVPQVPIYRSMVGNMPQQMTEHQWCAISFVDPWVDILTLISAERRQELLVQRARPNTFILKWFQTGTARRIGLRMDYTGGGLVCSHVMLTHVILISLQTGFKGSDTGTIDIIVSLDLTFRSIFSRWACRVWQMVRIPDL